MASTFLMHLLGLHIAYGLAAKSSLSSRTANDAQEMGLVCGRSMPVIPNDSCDAIANRCGVSLDDLFRSNPDSDICSTLGVGQSVCCSVRPLPAMLSGKLKRNAVSVFATLEEMSSSEVPITSITYYIVQTLSRILDDSAQILGDFLYKQLPENKGAHRILFEIAWEEYLRIEQEKVASKKAIEIASKNFNMFADEVARALRRLPIEGCSKHGRDLADSITVPVLMLAEAVNIYASQQTDDLNNLEVPDTAQGGADFLRFTLLLLPMAQHDQEEEVIDGSYSNTTEILQVSSSTLYHLGRPGRAARDVLDKFRLPGRPVWRITRRAGKPRALRNETMVHEIAETRHTLTNADMEELVGTSMTSVDIMNKLWDRVSESTLCVGKQV